MIHLSYSGEFAGVLLCGADRRDCEDRGDRMAHAIATPGSVLEGWRKSGELCDRCDSVWKEG